MTPFYWLVALAVLLVIEIITMGLTTIWFAGGALVAFVLALLGVPWLAQIAVFLVVSILLWPRTSASRTTSLYTSYNKFIANQNRL